MTQFSPVDLVIIRHAVEDHAASWYGQVGPFTFGVDDAARYTTEGVSELRPLVDRYGLAAVWQAVRAEIDRQPTILDRRLTNDERAIRHRQRTEAAQVLSSQGVVAFKAGDFNQALACLDEAELISPVPPGWRTWEQLRQIVREKAAEAATEA